MGKARPAVLDQTWKPRKVWRASFLGILLVTLTAQPASADPVAGTRIPLSKADPSLADVTVFSVSRQPVAGKPRSVFLYAYMAPNPLPRIAPTSMFLAMAARSSCGSGWALVRMMRDDLPWTTIAPAAPQGYSKIADASFDPDRIDNPEGSNVFAATRLATAVEVQQAEMFADLLKAYQSKGIDYARAERNAIRDIKKNFRISDAWHIPPGNATARTNFDISPIAKDAPSEIREALRPLCGGYQARPSG